MKRALAALLLALPAVCAAEGPYLDFSAGYAQGVEMDPGADRIEWLTGVHRQAEAGYEFGKYVIFVQHTHRPAVSDDKGMTMLGVRYRVWSLDGGVF